MSGGDVIRGGTVGAIVFDVDCIAFVAQWGTGAITQWIWADTRQQIQPMSLGLNGTNVGSWLPMLACQLWSVHSGQPFTGLA